MLETIRRTLQRHKLQRQLRAVQRRIRNAHAESLTHIGQQRIFLAEELPALSLELANLQHQLRALQPVPRPLLGQINKVQA